MEVEFYICDCGAAFPAEKAGRTSEPDVGYENVPCCPVCGSTALSYAQECAICGEICEDILCDDCKKEMQRTVEALVDEYPEAAYDELWRIFQAETEGR